MLGRFLIHVCKNGQYDEASLHCSSVNKAARASRAYKVDEHLAAGRWMEGCVWVSVHLVASNTSPVFERAERPSESW